jgi:release factor glutamine methyltransferase
MNDADKVPPQRPTMTWANALRDLVARFAAAKLDTPDTDARLLLAHCLGVERLQLIQTPDARLTPDQVTTLETAARRRLTREPVSRIIGQRWFYGRPFVVTPATLDPRPDSETLIEAVLAQVRTAGLQSAPIRLLDIGTGTGCLLLTLLAELPQATGVGTDISAAALNVARQNSQNLGISAARVDWRQGDRCAPAEGLFNVILSNPPYIPRSEIENLDADVRFFDPIGALDGGLDGLDFYRDLVVGVAKHIDTSESYVIFEIGHDQASEVVDLLRATPWGQSAQVQIHRDLGGSPRCVAGVPRQPTPDSAFSE